MSNSAAAAATDDASKLTLIVYSIHGSQFTAKVLAALQHYEIPHYVQGVPLGKKDRVKVIPSGGYLVPELQVVGTGGDDAVIVSDSEKILHWIDEHFDAAPLYPNQLASELSVRASDTKLAGFVWYYNWVWPVSYARSIRTALRNALPWWVNGLLPNFVVDLTLQSEKTKFRTQATRAIGVENEADLDDEPKMRQLMIDELTFFQAQLTTTTEQKFLVPGTTQPTAADFSVYAQVERLVGGTGAYDVSIHAAVPELLDVEDLQPLWTWLGHMQETCKVQFRGKKPPKEVLSAK